MDVVIDWEGYELALKIDEEEMRLNLKHQYPELENWWKQLCREGIYEIWSYNPTRTISVLCVAWMGEQKRMSNRIKKKMEKRIYSYLRGMNEGEENIVAKRIAEDIQLIIIDISFNQQKLEEQIIRLKDRIINMMENKKWGMVNGVNWKVMLMLKHEVITEK